MSCPSNIPRPDCEQAATGGNPQLLITVRVVIEPVLGSIATIGPPKRTSPRESAQLYVGRRGESMSPEIIDFPKALWLLTLVAIYAFCIEAELTDMQILDKWSSRQPKI
jgi:hypothetical protein